MACAGPQDPQDHTLDAALARASGQEQIAYLVIDAAAARVEAANAAGRLLLGLTLSAELPSALDSAMPAMQRLRLIASGQAPDERETLTFWINGRLATLTCSVKPVNANGSKHLIQLMQLGPMAEAPAAPLAPQATSQEDMPPAEEALPPIKLRDDAETLREIARRIREGQKANLGMPAQKPVTPQAGPGRSSHQDGEARKKSGTDAFSECAEPAALAKLAHELKTPLSAIIAASEIMRDQRLGPMGNDLYLGYAGDIHESAHHALALVTGMLETAASTASQKILSFDLNQVMVATVSAMQPLAHARGLIIAHKSDEGRLEITADPTAVRQILFNLLTNATKFTSAGGEVHAGTGYLPDGSIYLVVRDTGEGMDEDMLSRAFYDEAGEMNLRPGGGYGLGLPMVRRLAEANRGTIEIDSAPGKGTVVLISFPTRR